MSLTKIDKAVIYTALVSQFTGCSLEYIQDESDQLMFILSINSHSECLTFTAPYGCCFSGLRKRGMDYMLILFVQPEQFLNYYQLTAEHAENDQELR